LMPISTLVVPVLAREMREQAVSDGAFHPSSSCQQSRRQSIPGTAERSHAKAPNASAVALKKGSRLLPNEQRGSSPRELEAARARSKAERATTSKVSAAVKSKTANARSTFDWKAWSKS
jgi:hypothetical protein